MGYTMNGFSGFGNSPAKHGEKDPGKHKDKAAHKAWHDKHGFTKGGKTGSVPEERDFSEHNIAARETEGTIEQMEKEGKANPPKRRPR